MGIDIDILETVDKQETNVQMLDNEGWPRRIIELIYVHKRKEAGQRSEDCFEQELEYGEWTYASVGISARRKRRLTPYRNLNVMMIIKMRIN